MYYNKYIGRLVLDWFDCYILTALIVNYMVLYLKNYFSKKAKMNRLYQDLISNSRLIESSKSVVSLVSKSARIQKIYRFAISI